MKITILVTIYTNEYEYMNILHKSIIIQLQAHLSQQMAWRHFAQSFFFFHVAVHPFLDLHIVSIVVRIYRSVY